MSIRAGESFFEILSKNPEELARMRRVLRVQADVWRKLGPELADEIRAGLANARQELEAAGFEWRGEGLDPWVHIADTVEQDPGPLNLDEIRRKAFAWINREKIWVTIRQKVSPLQATQEQLLARVNDATLTSSAPAATKGKRIDERMMATIRDDSEATYWSCLKWAQHFDCSKTTVLETKTWVKVCKPARELERLSRGHRLRGKRKRPESDSDRP